MINLFYKDYLDKPIANFLAVNIALLIARPTIKPTKSIQLDIRQKRDCPAKNGANKEVKS